MTMIIIQIYLQLHLIQLHVKKDCFSHLAIQTVPVALE